MVLDGKRANWVKKPVNAYPPTTFLPEQNKLFRETIQVFADRQNYPVFFHCAGGVDRTGEIAFLLQMLLGLDEERAFQDYEISSLSRYPRSRNIPYFQAFLAGIAKFADPGDPLAVQVEKYLLGIGVSGEDIRQIREILIEPEP